ncbi:MAG: cupin domain-containing protein [Candidatus Eiseniibacteriota bacterium]
MKSLLPLALAAALVSSVPAAVPAEESHHEHGSPSASASSLPKSFTPEGMKWVDAMPSLPRGVRMAVLEGDPATPGPYTVRLWLPAGCRVLPYWRPETERLTVVLGAVILGLGNQFDDDAGVPIKAGSFALVPARRHHYLWTRDVAVVQMHGVGPWSMTYVDASLDPRHAKGGGAKH